MKISRYALLFPDMEPEEYEKLKEDIKEHGLLEPIVVKDGEIIDGKHRYKACLELGIEPKFAELPDGMSPLEYVIAKNLHRRHLTKDQRAVIAQEILPMLEEEAKRRSMANLKPFSNGQNTDTPKLAALGESREIAGKMLGVGHTYVSTAKSVLKKAPELKEPILKGRLKLMDAKRIADLPEEKRRIVLEKKLEEPERDVRIIIREVNNREKLENSPPLPEGKYQVIYADPPWKFEFSSSEPRTVENHYPTMELEEIKALKVPAADDAVLFLWAPAIKVKEALEVMEAWGFEYRSMMVWVKDVIGLGYYVRTMHELLLIGRKGSMPFPAPEDRPPSVVSAPRQPEHSQKPDVFYEIIEKMYPNARRIELFARRKREGWDSWGNEIE